MRNAVLHLLTNQSSGFPSPAFPDSSDFVPAKTTADQDTIRELLKINHPDNSYYLIGAMASVYSFPDIYYDFKETERTFELSDLIKNPDSFVGGTYNHSKQGHFYLHYNPDQWPAPLKWVISYHDAGTLSIRVGARRYFVKYHTSSSDVLYPEWPSQLGINGGIKLDSTWTSGSVVEIHHTPTTYPYEVVVAALDKKKETFSVLDAAGVTQQYYTAQPPIEKLAILLLALANPSKYYVES